MRGRGVDCLLCFALIAVFGLAMALVGFGHETDDGRRRIQ